jgi:hypothetical protein
VLTGLALTLLILALGFIRVWVVPTVAVLWIWLSFAQDIQGVDLRLGPRVPISDYLGVNLLPPGSAIGVEKEMGAPGNLVVFGASPTAVVQVDPFDPPPGIDLVYVSWLRAKDAPAGVKILKQTMGSSVVAWVEPGELARQLDARGLLVEPK